MKCYFRISVIAAIAAVFCGNTMSAQEKLEERFKAFSQLLSPEKLYLQTDRETYCVGDTIWFKGYLVNNSMASEFPESNYIYVELLDYYYAKNVYSNKIEETHRTVQRVKVKRRDGVLQGYVVLDSDMNTGSAILRAYPYWALNFPADYIFSKVITVINPIKDSFVKELVDKKVDNTEEYTKIGVLNPFKKEKTQKKDVDCQFLPESGRYFEGRKAVIGVKCVDDTGFGIYTEGEILDDNNTKVAEFKTNELGMGKFVFTPYPGRKYYARIKDNREVEKRVDLPSAENTGACINLSFQGDNIIAELYSTADLNKDSLFFILSDGTEVFYSKALSSAMKLALPIDKLQHGVNVATIADNSGNIFAKRPFFILPVSEGGVSMKADKSVYGQRDPVTCTITLPRPVSGDFSVSVTDDSHAPYIGAEDNIVSYMLLSSELKGYVENPQSYFDDSKPFAERESQVDLLMMTQGWQYYDLSKIFKGQYQMPQYGKEYIQTVSGRVRKSSLRRGNTSIVSFVAPSIGFTAMGQLDSSGYFELKDVNFPDSTLFIVNAVSPGGRKSFIPSITEDSFAPLVEYQRRKEKINYSNETAQYMLQNYYNSGGDKVYQLDAVYITGQRMVRAKDNVSPFPMQYFKEGQLKTEKDLEPYASFDVMTYILETCTGIREERDTTTGERKLVCRVPAQASNWEVSDYTEIIVYVNGFQAPSSSELDHYNIDELEAFVFLRGADAAPFSPMRGGSSTVVPVIMIKTKPSAGTGMPKNVSKGYPLGWQRPKHFYSPAYDVQGKSISRAGTDRRSTVYWKPDVKVENGEGKFHFNTSDGNSNYTVVIEGITNDGEYVFSKQEITRKRDY
ncbi:MAG: hypothetical protein II659_09630 [Bacteroidales bacterium]|nr:hypothetical protein [Bacteroidales bacterium]